MRNSSKSLGILAIGFLFSFGGCNAADVEGDEAPSAELQDAVVIAAPDVPGNLLIIAHDPGNSCAHPDGNGGDFTSYTRMKISLPPAYQTIGKFSVCPISDRQLQSCTDGPQCTTMSGSKGDGDATIELTKINGAQVNFILTGVQNCSWGFAQDPNSPSPTDSAFNGTYTAPRCD